MLVGSGVAGVGGTTLVYKSRDPADSWHFDGLLCSGHLDLGEGGGFEVCFVVSVRSSAWDVRS